MEFLPQPTDDENALIFDSVFRSKPRIDNPGTCAREYNSIMQIIIEALIGWDFKEGKQGFLGYLVKYWDGVTQLKSKEEKHYIHIFFCSLHCLTG
jgi:hypothetical protein